MVAGYEVARVDGDGPWRSGPAALAGRSAQRIGLAAELMQWASRVDGRMETGERRSRELAAAEGEVESESVRPSHATHDVRDIAGR
jgi:hypothetical protein